MLVVVVLLATVLMRLAIVTAVAYLLLPQGPVCPHCASDMVAIRNRVLDRLRGLLERRWCLECGWNGVVRPARPRPATRSRARSAPPRSPHSPRSPRSPRSAVNPSS